MKISEIRKLLSTRPFRPIVFHLDGGEKQLIADPQFLVTATKVIVVDKKGLPVFLTPKSIISSEPQRKPVRRRSTRITSRR
jgi:hypothetical protein